MTHAAPSPDFYDDGLVHSHDWSRSTPPGGKHGERTHQGSAEFDKTAPHEPRRTAN